MGIGGWYGSRPGMKVARERGSTVITISDVEELGVERAVEIALECAWKDAEAVFLSFDIDSIDAGFVPGTGSPEPGGLLPREALKALRMVAREGICGMEVVEIAPPYDVSDMTAQLGARAIMDVLGTLVEEGHLGSRPSRQEREQREHDEREQERREAELTGWLDDKAAPWPSCRSTSTRSRRSSLRGRRYADHAMVMTHQAFGPLVGVPRLLALLAEYELPATFFVPGLTAERYPETVRRIAEAGHEIGHHSYSHRSPVDLSESEERADFERALAALGQLGVDPSGHRAALWEASWRTPRARGGVRHALRLEPDGLRPSLPAWHGRRHRSIELPPHWGLDDWEQYAFLPRPDIGSVIESPREGPRDVEGRARRDAPARLSLHAHLPSVPVRASGAGRGASRPDRARPGGRRRRVRRRGARSPNGPPPIRSSRSAGCGR